MKMEKRTILITGGTSGIGLELAKQLIQRGNTVILTGRSQEKLDAARRRLPSAYLFQSDVSDKQAITALYNQVIAQFPDLDILINNAGILRQINFNQVNELEDITSEIEINLTGSIRMIQQFLPHLIKRKEALILNVSSALAFIPCPSAPVYSATKAALHSFTQSLRMQLKGSNVTVVELAPPAVETPMLKGITEEKECHKKMDVKILVRQALDSIEAGKTEIRPGFSNILKGLSRIAPGFMLNKMAKMTKFK